MRRTPGAPSRRWIASHRAPIRALARVAWYKAENDFNDGAPPTFENAAANGTVNFVAGIVNQAFGFAGTGFVTIAPGTGPLNITGTALTVDGWINPGVNSGFTLLMGRALSGGHDYALILNPDLQGVIKTGVGDPGLEHFVSTGFNPPLNTWTHIALTYNGSTITVYANGTVVGSATKTGGVSSSGGPFNIGGRIDCCGRVDLRRRA